MHYDELKKFTKIIEKLTKHCETFTNSRERVYKIYFDNQVLLKIIKEIRSTLN